jgi:hypothetical protein
MNFGFWLITRTFLVSRPDKTISSLNETVECTCLGARDCTATQGVKVI